MLFASVLLAPGGRASDQPTPPLAAQLEGVLSEAFRPDEPGAAVIVAKDGQTLLRKGYGLANVELGVPIQPEMVFRIGSVTKTFTAAAILLLEQQGKLSLDDDLTRFLPSFPTHGQHITVEHLLTHTSGIKSYTQIPEFQRAQALDGSVEELIALFRDRPLEFPAGSLFRYSNSGYALLGAVIEKASGQTYAEFLRQRIFEPLGMSHTRYGDDASIVPGRVCGYGRRRGTVVNAAYVSQSRLFAAGGVASTVDDLARWDASLYTGIVLSEASRERMWKARRLPTGETTGYGYGWFIGEYQGHPMLAHGGEVSGFTCQVLRLPADRLFVALLTNRDGPDPAPLARRLAAIAIGRPMPTRSPVVLPAQALEACVGRYQLTPKIVLRIARDGDHLTFDDSLGTTSPLFAESETEFFFKEVDTQVTFVRDASGSVTGLTLHHNGRDTQAKRLP